MRTVVAALLTVMAFVVIFVGAMLIHAHGHDRDRPDLDQWYGNLKRPGVLGSQPFGSVSCCSMRDCHTTEAELRGSDWWARVGVQKKDGNWDLRDWMQVPADAVLERHDNPAGEAVICHSVAWVNNTDGTQTLNAKWVAIWCFIPPTES